MTRKSNTTNAPIQLHIITNNDIWKNAQIEKFRLNPSLTKTYLDRGEKSANVVFTFVETSHYSLDQIARPKIVLRINSM